MFNIDDTALFFMHIPKTAGTSMRLLLEKVFNEKQRVYLYGGEPPGITLEAFRELPNDVKERIRLVYGHFRFGVHEWLPQKARYITMLRDPVDRVASLYYFYKRHPGSKQHQMIVEDALSLEAFVFNGRFLQTDNEMVRQLSGIGRFRNVRHGECSEEVLDMAWRNIEDHFEWVLFMDDMQRSLVKLGEILGRTVKDIGQENVNKTRQPIESIDPLILEKIEAFNRFDRALYDRAKRAFGTV